MAKHNTRQHNSNLGLGIYTEKNPSLIRIRRFTQWRSPMVAFSFRLHGMGCLVRPSGVVHRFDPNLFEWNERGVFAWTKRGAYGCECRPRQLRRVHRRRHVVLFAALASAPEDVCEELPQLEEEKTGWES